MVWILRVVRRLLTRVTGQFLGTRVARSQQGRDRSLPRCAYWVAGRLGHLVDQPLPPQQMQLPRQRRRPPLLGDRGRLGPEP